MRNRLPDTRPGITRKVTIEDIMGGSINIFITINKYPETGKIAEIFVNLGKQGSTLQGMVDGWCMLLSIALQHEVPLESIIDKFSGQSFPPSGAVLNPDIEKCSSILDLICSVLMSERNSV